MQSQYTAVQVARFRAKLARQGDCLVWTGHRNRQGYGLVRIDNRVYLAHRVSYSMAGRPLTADIDVCHACDNPPCVNPAHLFPGDARINTMDSVSKGRHRAQIHPEQTFRGEGHPMAKLTEGVVLEIRRRYGQGGISQSQLAREYDTTQSRISYIVNRKHWAHID